MHTSVQTDILDMEGWTMVRKIFTSDLQSLPLKVSHFTTTYDTVIDQLQLGVIMKSNRLCSRATELRSSKLPAKRTQCNTLLICVGKHHLHKYALLPGHSLKNLSSFNILLLLSKV